MKSDKRSHYKTSAFIIIGLLCISAYLFAGVLFRWLGAFLVVDDSPTTADAVVVLNTGVEYYPRLIEAADLYRKGIAPRIIINGNRKTDILRELEAKGFQGCCRWYENSVRILVLLGVPEGKIIPISVEDAYDTISEAVPVGEAVLKLGHQQIIITTSKFHTRRARKIWQESFQHKLEIFAVAAKTDPFDPEGWWRQGRQIRWVLAEYGAWVFYYWKKLTNFS